MQRTAIVGGVVLALATGGYALRDRAGRVPPAPEPTADAALVAAPAPVVEEQDEAPEAAVIAPSFDVVRITADGGALVAGAAEPGAALALRVDGVTVAETVADASGQFVALFSLDPSVEAQTMTLESRRGDGGVEPSADTVILAPRDPVALVDAVALSAEPAPADADPSMPEPVAENATPWVPPPPPRPEARTDGAAIALAAPDSRPTGVQSDALPEGPPAGGSTEARDAPDPEPAAQTALAPAPALPAPNASQDPGALPQAFVLRQGGSVEVSGPAPQPADAVVIDAISYSDSGAVQISGRAGRADPEARVQLYLDNEPLALARAERGGWSVAVPDLAPGLYTLRADQLAEDGRVVTRFETPFQRATPEDIARPPARPGRDGEAQAQLITVQPGNSLWRISRERYGEGVRYVQIYQANLDQIRDPDLIYPGQIFVLPD